jgi:hypothetical protein
MALNMRKRAAAASAAAPASSSAAKGGSGAAAAAAHTTVVVDPSVITPMDLGPGGRHFGPVTAIQRNPFYPAAYLTTGDWGVRLWHEKNRGPILTTPYSKASLTGGETTGGGVKGRGGPHGAGITHTHTHTLIALVPASPPPPPRGSTAGCWSASRPGVLYTTRTDGVLDAWDLLFACVSRVTDRAWGR